MKISTETVQKLIITDVPDLDPLAVYLEDHAPGAGKITITCFNDCWSFYWSHMGEKYDIRSFFLNCDEHYLAGKLSPGLHPKETHLDGIVEHVRMEILKQRRQDNMSKDSARKYWDEADDLDGTEDSWALFDRHGEIMFEVLGDEWWDCLPERPNHKYEYLCRIINTVKEALKGEQIEKQA